MLPGSPRSKKSRAGKPPRHPRQTGSPPWNWARPGSRHGVYRGPNDGAPTTGRWRVDSFDASSKSQRASRCAARRLTFVGWGFFDLHVNGRRVGDQLMNPALTGYDKRCLYVAFDITKHLCSGANAVGLVLSNGRFFAPRSQNPVPMRTYGFPKAIGQVHVQFDDGSEQLIVTDEQWKLTAEGPLRASNEFDGEAYDARREMPGWDAPGFDDSAWRNADRVDPPGGDLEAQMVEPIRVTQVLHPVQMLQPKPGVWMVDFGQAFYGVVRLRVKGPRGTRVSMRTSFNVLPDGTLNFANDRSARNTDVYTLKGRGLETWNPRFRGNATRWVQVEGFPGEPTLSSFAGLVTHTDHQAVGRFACSNPLVNRIYHKRALGNSHAESQRSDGAGSRRAHALVGPSRQDVRERRLGFSTSPASTNTFCTTTANIRPMTEACRRFCLRTGCSTARTLSGRASSRSSRIGITTSTATIDCCATTMR